MPRIPRITNQQILEAARQVFLQQGLAKNCTKLGLSKPTLGRSYTETQRDL
ncbi:hypothetical protein [Nostoc sp.]|uniref:hypothetical protein n=1 Tax=Nostoc sp. TaxID=1180 RepID=UPI002FF5A9DF